MRALVHRDGAAAVFAAADLAAETLPVPPRAMLPRDSVGILPLGARVGLGAAPPFGRMQAGDFTELVRAARAEGTRGLRLTPWRTIGRRRPRGVPCAGARKTTRRARLHRRARRSAPRRGDLSRRGPPVRMPRATSKPMRAGLPNCCLPYTQSSCTSAAAPRDAPAPRPRHSRWWAGRAATISSSTAARAIRRRIAASPSTKPPRW